MLVQVQLRIYEFISLFTYYVDRIISSMLLSLNVDFLSGFFLYIICGMHTADMDVY